MKTCTLLLPALAEAQGGLVAHLLFLLLLVPFAACVDVMF